jgi:hypothetical protein
MSGRKELLWALVVSAALFTAGLILSCGDDDGNGEAATDCQGACEKLKECNWFSGFYYFGYTVRDCVYICEEELAGDAAGNLAELYECIADADCEDLDEDCFFQPLCEKLVTDCEIWPPPVSDCVDYCHEEEPGYCFYLSICSLAFSSCQYIEGFCPIYF